MITSKSPFFILPVLLLFAVPSHAEKATAVIKATQENSKVSGLAAFEDTSDGLKISATVSNASPGKHAIHIHEFGDCGDSGKAAGSHYNPEKAPHGLVTKDGPMHAHVGDLGNIELDAAGQGKLNALLPGVALSSGKYTVVGRSLILHEKEDDFSQPAGNAGSRIGCGAITLEPTSGGA